MGPAFSHESELVHQSEMSRLQSQLRSRPQYHLQSLRQSLRSLKDFDDTRLGWDPGPRHMCLSGDLGGPGPPSGPAHQARVRHPHPGLSHRQPHLQWRLHLHLSCHLLPGLGGRCSSGTPSCSDVPALMVDPRFRDSMRLMEHYSLLPFMRLRQYYYPRVVLQFYHSLPFMRLSHICCRNPFSVD